jgi:hypothetical protein
MSQLSVACFCPSVLLAALHYSPPFHSLSHSSSLASPIHLSVPQIPSPQTTWRPLSKSRARSSCEPITARGGNMSCHSTVERGIDRDGPRNP